MTISNLPLIDHAHRHWRFFRHHRVLRVREIVSVVGLSTLTVLAEATGIALLLPILAFIENDRDVEKFAASSKLAGEMVAWFQSFNIPITLISLSLIAIALITTRQVVNYFYGIASERMKWGIGRRLSVRYTDAVLASTGSHLRSYKPGEFIVLADHECQASATVARIYTTMWMTALSFAAYGGVLIVAQPRASAFAFAVVVALLVSLRFLIRKTHSLADLGIGIRKEQVDFLNERFRAWKLIKLANTNRVEVGKADAIAARVATNRVDLARVAGLMMLAVAPILSAFLLVTLYVFVEVLRVDLSTVMLFGIVLIRLIPLSQTAQSQLQRLSQFDPSLRGIDKAINDANAHRELLDRGAPCPTVGREIRFENVSFTYPDRDHAAVTDISVSIPVGQFTAIVGPSGAGKSTLVDLIPRIIDPTSGRIRLDDVPATDIALGALRDSIAYVSQEPFLFDASVADNIRYGRNDATDAEVLEAARLANAADFIEALPGGFDARLGDTGSRLSGGQKQRIVLARAFLRNAQIFLLDEPTSALDHGSEAAIQQAIEDIVHTRAATVVVIAHRLSTVRNADFVIHLEGGRLRAAGTAERVLEPLRDAGVALGLTDRNEEQALESDSAVTG